MKARVMAATIPVLISIQAFAADEVGFLVRNASGEEAWNEATILRREYTGQCPGTEQSKVEAFFRTSDVEPAKGQKVIVQNTSLSREGERLPYTIRDYDRGSYADRAYLGLSDQHKSKFLAVREGENNFFYRVVDRDDQTISSGVFTATVGLTVEVKERNKECRWESSCTEYVCVPVLICSCP